MRRAEETLTPPHCSDAGQSHWPRVQRRGRFLFSYRGPDPDKPGAVKQHWSATHATIEEAVAAPRIHHQWRPDRIRIEEGGAIEDWPLYRRFSSRFSSATR